MEHQSKSVPWQFVAGTYRCGCCPWPALTETGELDLEDIQAKTQQPNQLRGGRCFRSANTLGCLNPIEAIAKLSHDRGALLLVDACPKPARHLPVKRDGPGA